MLLCNVNVRFIKKKSTILFQIGEVDVPDGLQYAGSIVILKLVMKNYFSAAEVNKSNKDIMLKRSRKPGHLEYLNCIEPLELKDIVNTSPTMHSINKEFVITPKTEYHQNIRKNRVHQSNTRSCLPVKELLARNRREICRVWIHSETRT